MGSEIKPKSYNDWLGVEHRSGRKDRLNECSSMLNLLIRNDYPESINDIRSHVSHAFLFCAANLCNEIVGTREEQLSRRLEGFLIVVTLSSWAPAVKPPVEPLKSIFLELGDLVRSTGSFSFGSRISISDILSLARLVRVSPVWNSVSTEACALLREMSLVSHISYRKPKSTDAYLALVERLDVAIIAR